MKIVIIVLTCTLLTSCAVSDFFSKTWKILKDSSVPVGEVEDRPSTLGLSMNASSDVNPNRFSNSNSDLDNVIIEGGIDASPGAAVSLQSPPAIDAELAISEASPIVFNIIQLTHNAPILQADFDSLFEDIEKALGTSYLTHTEYILAPNEFKYIAPIPVEEGVQYIAVVAAYHDYNNAIWKRIIKINPMGEEIILFINLNEYAVEVKTEEKLQ